MRAADAIDDSPLTATSAGSALALLSPGLGDKQIATARATVLEGGPLASRYGVRSLDRDDPERSARNYWRGPVWANVTWLTAHALALHGEPLAAQELRGQMLKAVEADGMREYFAPESGRGLGARDFGWTAALCLSRGGRT